MAQTEWLIAIALAYGFGSIPFGLLIGLAKGVDIREHGSRNIGATNCGRVLGRAYGLACLALDMVKGAAPVMAAGLWFDLSSGEAVAASAMWWWMGVAGAAVLGHVFPIWLGFRGGKGVATAFGVLLGAWPYLTLPALAAMGTWLIFTSTLRYVSLASMMAALALPGYVAFAGALAGWPSATAQPLLAVTAGLAVLVVLRHRGNVVRLCRGVESRV